MADFDLDASFIPTLHKPSSLLPIAKHRDALLYSIETYPVTVIIGQTGSGKTTQIPQFLEQAGWCADGKMIGVTQPRRIAATTIAMRVAEELGIEVGKEVGYAIRFEDVTSPATRIKFMTDGMLIREALSDPLLSRYSIIMVDEAHERSISTDILLGLLKKIQKRRPELRIVVSSATLQAEEFYNFFTRSDGNKVAASHQQTSMQDEEEEEEEDKEDKKDKEAKDKKAIIISVEGRAHPIDVLFLQTPAEDYVQKAVDVVFDIHAKVEGAGDILVFLAGREEIETAVELVSEQSDDLVSRGRTLTPMPLYAGLTSEQQMYIFDKTADDSRKVVFSTNIAEASVTIDGIAYVVDSGFVKIRAYDPNSGLEALVKTETSKASAAQRAGRAGRTRPGKCFRLYTEEDYDAMAETTVPEIQRTNLAPTILQLKALGIDNVLRFNYLSPPPSKLMARGLELLYALGALNEYAKLTRPLGMQMAELALEPMMAKTLLSAKHFDCLSEMLSIAAMATLAGSVWFYQDGEKKKAETAKRRFAVEEGDHLTLLNVYHAFVTRGKQEAKFCRDHHLNFKSMTRAVSVRAQLKRQLEGLNIPVVETSAVSSSSSSLTSSLPASRNSGSHSKMASMGIKKATATATATATVAADKAEKIRRCLTAGYFSHAARMQQDGTFVTVDGSTTLHAHPNSILFQRKADWVIFHEALQTGGDKIFIRDVTAVEKAWLLEYGPGFYQVKEGGGGWPGRED